MSSSQRSEAALPERVAVVVVGAGVNGLAAARSTVRRGVETLVVEQHAIGTEFGGSRGDARVFAFVHPEPAWVPMCVAAHDLWRELEAEAGRAVLDADGGLYATRRADELTPHLGANDVPYEVLSAAATRERFPVRLDDDVSVIWTPTSGTFAATEALHALRDSAAAHGAAIAEGVTVTGLLEEDPGVRVQTSRGDVVADVVIVAAGAWTTQLVAPLGIDLPTRALRGTVAYFPLGGDQYVPPLFEEGQPHVYTAVSPEHGLKMGESRLGRYDLPPGELCEPDQDSIARLAERAAERFPTADPSRPYAETCLFTYTADVTFKLARQGRVVTAVACEGRGFKFAPLTGERLADLALADLVPA